jgi:deoxyribodipyrimidine photo-lyase
MPTINDARVRPANGRAPDPARAYVLYWMQAYRRLNRNHALDHALDWCRRLMKPLVVYEGLRLDYPWACARHHRFLLDGMRDNAAAAAKLGVTYWPFVETPDRPARGLLKKIAGRSCLVVTDDYPAFVVPGQTAALAAKADAAVVAVDGNGLAPLRRLGPAASAAAHFRPRLHRLFAEAWQSRAAAVPDVSKAARGAIDPPFEPWAVNDDRAAAALPVDRAVAPVPGVVGGTTAGRAVLRAFVRDRLPRYAAERNGPADPARNAASGLSFWLRHGHVSVQEVAEAVLGRGWSPGDLNPACAGKREDFFHPDPNVNAFLDEALVWRDLGYHWHSLRGSAGGAGKPDGSKPVYHDLATALPAWALATLRKHAGDRRGHEYSLEELEAADTHDPLWNAAQTELVRTGRIHNYLRMLWGKKVLEWSATPEAAYATLEHLNNKYALDGRDPNSYSGILWCFGLFDRPWPPERLIFGSVRYMSSDNTARKFDLGPYYEYVGGLTSPPASASPRAGP